MVRVLVFGAWDDGVGYPRPRSLLRALNDTGHEVVAWRLPSTFAGQRRIDVVRRPWRWPAAAARVFAAGRRARTSFAAARAAVTPDVVVVPYPGHFMAPMVRSVFRGPIVLDLFLSAHDTAVEDRGYFGPRSLVARALAGIDRRACEAADLVLLDTPTHAQRVATTCGLPAGRVGWLPVGDPDAAAAAEPYPELAAPLRLLFFGTGVPLHGLPVLVEAVERCGGSVHLDVIGGSPAERRAIAARPSSCVTLGPAFVDRVPLQRAIAAAHVVCGVFGRSGKTARVIPFKVMHALAAGRPVLTGDTPAVREWMQPGHDVLVAPTDDAAALADTLQGLVREADTLPAIARAARAAYERRFSPEALADQCRALLAPLLGAHHAPDRRASVHA
ncbi:MAG: glycosyltransferase [Planctomycetota bacterium]